MTIWNAFGRPTKSVPLFSVLCDWVIRALEKLQMSERPWKAGVVRALSIYEPQFKQDAAGVPGQVELIQRALETAEQEKDARRAKYADIEAKQLKDDGKAKQKVDPYQAKRAARRWIRSVHGQISEDTRETPFVVQIQGGFTSFAILDQLYTASRGSHGEGEDEESVSKAIAQLEHACDMTRRFIFLYPFQ
jgi:hypothetical protein